jgi:hypothetical protein
VTTSGTPVREKEKLRFFVLCAEAQIIDPETKPRDPGIYENRPEAVPYDATGLAFGSPQDPRQWYSEYLELKFRFFRKLLDIASPAELNADPGQLVRDAFGDGDPDGVARLIEVWREQAGPERLAYLHRVAQLPRDVVDERWYNSLPSFTQWANEVLAEQRRDREEVRREGLGKAYERLAAGAEAVGPSLDADELLAWAHDQIVRTLAHQTDGVTQALRSEPPPVAPEPLEEYFGDERSDAHPIPALGSPVPRVAEQVTGAWLALLKSGEGDLGRYLRAFTEVVSSEFECEVCDYLQVTNDALHLAATSAEGDVSRVGESEQYARGEGITGSVLLLDFHLPLRWVGTNNLDADPRMSPWHLLDYKEIYGEVSNFWVLPVWTGHRITGAFRVINWRPNGAESPAPWPYYVRVQLVEVAQWFAQAVRLVEQSTMLLTRASRASRGDAESVTALTTHLALNWLSAEHLDDVLAHLRSVVHRRVEERRLGAAVLLAPSVDLDAAVSFLGPYPSVPGPLSGTLNDDAAKLYRQVDPTAGVFAIDAAGKLRGVWELRTREGHTGYACARWITGRWTDALVFVIERGQETVRILQGGDVSADYYLSHGTGTWKLRLYQPLLDRFRTAFPELPGEIVQDAYKRAWELAYRGVGATMYIADDLPDSVRREGGFEVRTALAPLSEVEFADLASIDGALLITTKGEIVRAGTIYSADAPAPDLQWLEKAGKGSRHAAAAHVSAAAPAAAALVVSKNRGISLFGSGSPIFFDE